MAIGRLQAALAAATNEVTVAAANLNFDFTLVKYEAPKEYQALGNVLTSKRKDDAELGSIHVLARQLGALFDGICPATPALLEAYGKRASEIAQASKVISEPYAGTLFGDYTGIDGTSIWAAATSSKCALHVHLLACLLARVWTAPEAIAIWVEIVAERKREIARKVDNEEPVAFSLAAAVGQDISRSQLAVWDTSARAWLRTADDVFCRQQKQLELILKNIDLAAPGGPAVFPSVIETWKIAITTMDRLISGIPQAVQDAAALLGLSAWHLYPDLSLYDPEMVEVKMGDSLVDTGGVLSIGVSKRPDITGRENSIYWSLSLAQLRYYGHPVKVERGLGAECRLTLAQLDLVIFAVLLEEWRYEESESESVARAVISLVDRVNMSQLGSLHEKRLLKILRDGASALINPLNGSQDMTRRLIQLGRRRALRLLYNSNDPRKLDEQSAALFDLLDGENFMSLFRDTESQIRFLRHKAELLTSENIPSDAYIIRYTQPGTPWVDESSALDKDRPPCRSSAPNTPRLSGSTAITTLEDLSLQTPDAPETLVERPAAKDTPRQEPHANRISSEYSTAALNDQTDSEGESDSDYSLESEAEILEDDVDVSDAEDDQNTHRPVAVSHAYGNGSRYYLLATALIPVPCGQAENTPHHRWVPKHLRGVAIPDGEVITRDMDEKFNLWHDCIKIVATEPSDDYVYHHVMGNTTTAALFARKIPDVFVPDHSDATIEDLQWCLDNDLLSPTNLIHHICISESSRVSKTLAAFAKAALIYDGLTDATVDANILNSTLTSKHWASETWRVTMSPELTLSLIAYFESGTHDIDPDQLKNVIAVSYANSLFVASAVR
ncbi:uncharacterized protein J4E78_003039 [Alternaria triticimaculans]|uniref:uncharacterized protein n=1 Tax=Alternaria triticimaculans TaxID=297637 RepID=UPI0020C468A1|nr:uncharacterized protein J4E78_003039 [Alternaria triticimaculans]KAI4665577.1 hypothetical protein J4E78_003039 [Alternaria triticimaculans]